MHDFLLKEITNTDLETELINIGYDKSYAFKGKEKFEYKNFKIFGITSAQGNIIKQLALSVGADCGTHHDVIIGKTDNSDCILGGNISQLKTIADKLEFQPFGLKFLGQKLKEFISEIPANKTKIMGILNITPNSFSDGGKYLKYDDAIKHLNELIDDGADIIDIGAESTKPGAKSVDDETQLSNIIPVLEYIKNNNINIPISIDTRSSKVAGECFNYGVNIINDVSGFDYDSKMAEIIALNQNVKIIIQHSNGTPDVMQNNTQYTNLIDDIYKSLSKKINYAISKGINKENIIIDPGIGFGKTREQNFEIIKRWKEFRTLGCPVMLGISRKSFLNMQQNSNEEKDIYTLAINSCLINENIDYIRVHNVKIHKNLLAILN